MFIKSFKNLCSNYDIISNLAHSTGKPIFITKEGEGDLVILSMDAYENIIRNSNDSVRRKESNDNTLSFIPTVNEGGLEMNEYDLGRELKSMYENAPKGDQVAFIHLFGIKYAELLTTKRLSKVEILKIAEMPESYQTEISKGIRLAKYVTIKEIF